MIVTKFLILGFLAIALTGCFAQGSMDAPQTDMRGVNPEKYANDLAACRAQKAAMGFTTFGAPIARCMRARGYTVLDDVAWSAKVFGKIV